MPSSRRLIASNTLTTSAASVTFSSIPGTYTDLVLRISARTDRASATDNLTMTFNSDTATNYSYTLLQGDGATPTSTRSSSQTNIQIRYIVGDTSTANTFSSCEIYIPSYTLSQNKPVSGVGIQETNATAANLAAAAGLWRNTAAITSIVLNKAFGTNFISGSSFFLYGINNS